MAVQKGIDCTRHRVNLIALQCICTSRRALHYASTQLGYHLFLQRAQPQELPASSNCYDSILDLHSFTATNSIKGTSLRGAFSTITGTRPGNLSMIRLLSSTLLEKEWQSLNGKIEEEEEDADDAKEDVSEESICSGVGEV